MKHISQMSLYNFTCDKSIKAEQNLIVNIQV